MGFCEDPSPYIAAAELVIAQAGHSTAMEILDYESFNGEILYEKIKLLLNENRFKEKAKLFSENSREMKGSQKAADIILELSNRIHSY